MSVSWQGSRLHLGPKAKACRWAETAANLELGPSCGPLKFIPRTLLSPDAVDQQLYRAVAC